MLDVAISMPVVTAPTPPAQATAPEAPGAFAQELEQASANGKAQTTRPAADPPAETTEADHADAAQAAAADLAALLASLQYLPPAIAEPQAVTPGKAKLDDALDEASNRAEINALLIAEPTTQALPAVIDPQARAQASDPLPPAPLAEAVQAARAAAGLSGAIPTAEQGALAARSGVDADSPREGSADTEKPIKNIRPMPVEPGTTSQAPATPRDALATTTAVARRQAADASISRAALPADQRLQAEPAANLAAPLPNLAASAPSAPGSLALNPSPGPMGGAAAPFQAMLNAALGSPEFAPALGTQVSMLARDGFSQARLHLHPAELGPIAVQIELNGLHAQVNMSAEHALTRQALEQALPALAGALRDAGLTLTGGGVFQQPQHAPRGPDGDARPPAGHRAEADVAADAADEAAHDVALAAALPRPRIQRGALDLYA